MVPSLEVVAIFQTSLQNRTLILCHQKTEELGRVMCDVSCAVWCGVLFSEMCVGVGVADAVCVYVCDSVCCVSVLYLCRRAVFVRAAHHHLTPHTPVCLPHLHTTTTAPPPSSLLSLPPTHPTPHLTFSTPPRPTHHYPPHHPPPCTSNVICSTKMHDVFCGRSCAKDCLSM